MPDAPMTRPEPGQSTRSAESLTSVVTTVPQAMALGRGAAGAGVAAVTATTATAGTARTARAVVRCERSSVVRLVMCRSVGGGSHAALTRALFACEQTTVR